MRVREVRVYAVELPVRGHYAMSSASVGSPTSTVVEIEASDGSARAVGHGEVCMASPRAQAADNPGICGAVDRLAPAIIGLDPSNIGRVRTAMDAVLDGNAEAKAAIDIACWDLFGKSVGRPVCDLLGGALSDRVPTYHVVQIGPAQEAAAEAARLQERGLTRLQLKAGGRPIEADIESIHAVAETLRPGTTLAVDANRGWTMADASLVSGACRDLRLSIEQPCRTLEECLAVDLHHPLVVDESATDLATITRAAATGRVAGFGMKLSRVGGIGALRAVRDLCVAMRLPTSTDDAWGGDIIAAACVHVGSTVPPSIHRGTWIAQPYVGRHYDPDHGPRIDDGHIELPRAGPGLGLRLDAGTFGEPVAAHS